MSFNKQIEARYQLRIKELKSLLKDAYEILEQFKYEQDEDSPSNSFFEARLNEDGFFFVKHNIEKVLLEIIKPCTDERMCTGCFTGTSCTNTTPDTAIQRKVLEARIDELNNIKDYPHGTVKKLTELREQLAALGE